jgi:hypothetical protein
MATCEPQVVVRTSPPFYWLVGGILGSGLVLGVFVVIARTSAAWPPTAILGCLLAAAMSVLLSTKLTLTADSIHYRSLFVRRDVPLADIVGAKFVAGFSSFKPHQRLIVTVRGRSGQRDITINTGLFDRTEIKRWVDTLNARLT